MMNKSVFFSILIPNLGLNENFKKCINSVAHQRTANLFDYEIIVLDQSDDNVYEDVNKIINDENVENMFLFRSDIKSLLKARHNLMSKAKGKYICFIDSDDYVLDNYLLTIFNCLKSNSFPDTLVHTYRIQEVGESNYKVPNYPNDICDKIKDYFFFSNYLNSIIAKTFKKDLYSYEDYTDFDTVIGEDWVFSFPIISKSKMIVFDKNIDGYFYIQNKNSITHNFCLTDGIKTLYYRDSYFNKICLNHSQLDLFLNNKITAFCNSLIPLVRNKSVSYKEFRTSCKDFRNNLFFEFGFKKGKLSKKRYKITFCLLKLKFYRFLYIFFKV